MNTITVQRGSIAWAQHGVFQNLDPSLLVVWLVASMKFLGELKKNLFNTQGYSIRILVTVDGQVVSVGPDGLARQDICESVRWTGQTYEACK